MTHAEQLKQQIADHYQGSAKYCDVARHLQSDTIDSNVPAAHPAHGFTTSDDQSVSAFHFADGSILVVASHGMTASNMPMELRKVTPDHRPSNGAIAICSAGCLGLITSDCPVEVTYSDGNKATAWTGIHLTSKSSAVGNPWSSKNPTVVGHINSFTEKNRLRQK